MTSVLARVHNPTGRTCGCSDDCVCRRTTIGRALRWYIPGRLHSGPTADEKRARAFQRQGST
jgi:hypothetical protein